MSLAPMLVLFTLHCTEGHGSAVTTANSIADLPLPVATNTGFPMSLSVATSSEVEAVTTGIAEGE